jgi:transmembrane sensor
VIELDRPLKSLLREPARPDVEKIWEAVRTRRRYRTPPRSVRWALAPALCVAAAWLIARTYLAQNPPPLSLSDGGAITTLSTGAEPRTITLSDGSRLDVGPDAQLAPRSVDATHFSSELVRGRVTFDVVPHGPRRWTISAGDVQVSVLGTRFGVERGARGVEIDVQRGLVEVTGPGVPNSTRRLGAGERLLVPSQPLPASDSGAAATGGARSPAAASTAEPGAPGDGAMPAADGGGRPSSRAPGVRREAAAARSRRDSAETAVPSRRGAAEEQTGIEALLARADAARQAGQPAAAARAFREIIDRHPDDPRTALGAFTLGQLYLDQLARPDLAARALIQARTLGLPLALAEEGAARLVEAFCRTGQTDKAHEAGLDYLARYPEGARRHQVESWMGFR